ncbi:MAG: sigma-70 family RNA polymerase sigma factor [Candidatus Brocadiia bacterium]
MPKTDLELGHELKQGNDAAYKEVVERFSRPVFSICIKLLRDPIAAQDASQDVFVRMFRGIDTFDANRPLSSWLFRITYNRCMDYLKMKGRNIEIAVEDLEVADDSTPLEESENTRLAELMWKSLDDLPEQYRMILLFKYRFNLKNAEISEIMSITENNLRVKVFRAKRQLRETVTRKLSQE